MHKIKIYNYNPFVAIIDKKIEYDYNHIMFAYSIGDIDHTICRLSEFVGSNDWKIRVPIKVKTMLKAINCDGAYCINLTCPRCFFEDGIDKVVFESSVTCCDDGVEEDKKNYIGIITPDYLRNIINKHYERGKEVVSCVFYGFAFNKKSFSFDEIQTKKYEPILNPETGEYENICVFDLERDIINPKMIFNGIPLFFNDINLDVKKCCVFLKER